MYKLLKSKSGIVFLIIVVMILQYLIFIGVGQALFFVLDFLDGISPPPSLNYIGKETGIDIDNGEIRGGYTQRDGMYHSHSYLEVKMPYSIDEQLKNNTDWQSLPLSESVNEFCRIDIDGESECSVSEFENGCFYFDIEENSYAFTLAVYNADTNMIYYYSRS